ncbi:hypothetical protein [Streptomyces sp. NPDC060031]|uniref:hypothetical protein n=1 Tax=Streptomyces sp. NPDC060031 TaxID=3347043 RepID=UPI00369E5ED9
MPSASSQFCLVLVGDTPNAVCGGVRHQEEPLRVRAEVLAGGGFRRRQGNLGGEPASLRGGQRCLWVNRYHIKVILDAHQDVYGPRFGSRGIPAGHQVDEDAQAVLTCGRAEPLVLAVLGA